MAGAEERLMPLTNKIPKPMIKTCENQFYRN